MYIEKSMKTRSTGYQSITADVVAAVAESGVKEGYCLVNLPEETTGLCITSFWDVRGLDDLMDEIDRNMPNRVMFETQTTPKDVSGNIKSLVVGRSAMILINDGKLQLGSSQGLVLLDFDGPRNRNYQVQIKETNLVFSKHSIKTSYMDMVDLTDDIKNTVTESGVTDGICHISQIHSTAGILLCAKDDLLRKDIMDEIERMVPTRADFKHQETASDAGGHVKTAITDSQISIPVKNGVLQIDDNQAVVFAEFDGPRPRTYYVGVIS